MARPQRYFDWQQIAARPDEEPIESTRQRLRWILAFFAAALAIIFVRAVQLEIADGENFRTLAARPIERVPLAASRGRILARDGTVLAADRQAVGLAVQYRFLEQPPNPDWLRSRARARLPRAERRNRQRLAAMEETVRGELADLQRRLARLCNVSDAQWQARAGRIQKRVDSLAASVNQRRLDRHQADVAAELEPQDVSVATIVWGLFAPPENLPPAPVIVAEQIAFHRLVDDLPSEVAAELKTNARLYPGVQVVDYVRRDYPLGTLAAHVVGHVSSRPDDGSIASTPDSSLGRDRIVGLMGLERRYEDSLAGRPGLEIQTTDHRGKQLSTARQREPVPGRDVVLTLDIQLQLSAEQWLDRQARRQADDDGPIERSHGGAIVVMEVRSGELLTAASGPRFDPNWFAAGDARLAAVLDDPRRPLFDRAAKMALPPGSVFKPLTALALLESRVIDPQHAFRCQGYFDDPDRLRCQIFRRHGIGHGDVTLVDALAQSCNTYFFHYAADLGAVRLLDWASRFGFAQPTRIELADEIGQLPTIDQLRRTSQMQMFAVGQGAFTATPLEILRVYAAIANGGYLIAPRMIHNSDEAAADDSQLSESTRIAGLSPLALATVREGLRKVVDDPSGTAYDTVRLPSLPIAGKTGTAETGGNQPDHAWFAGYAPADAPRYAFVVVLEHAGSGTTAAGTLAKSVVQRMQQLGYFTTAETADKSLPPGKG